MLFWLISNCQQYFVKSLGYYEDDFINQNLWRPYISLFLSCTFLIIIIEVYVYVFVY